MQNKYTKRPSVDFYLARKRDIIKGHCVVAMFIGPIFDDRNPASFFLFIHLFLQQIHTKLLFYNRYSECWGYSHDQNRETKPLPRKTHTPGEERDDQKKERNNGRYRLKYSLVRGLRGTGTGLIGRTDRINLSGEICEQKSDSSNGVSHRASCRTSVPGRETNKDKEPVSGVSFLRSKDSRKVLCQFGKRRGKVRSQEPSHLFWM